MAHPNRITGSLPVPNVQALAEDRMSRYLRGTSGMRPAPTRSSVAPRVTLKFLSLISASCAIPNHHTRSLGSWDLPASSGASFRYV
ncbi:unnamed protein product [Urochloa humidicola]